VSLYWIHKCLQRKRNFIYLKYFYVTWLPSVRIYFSWFLIIDRTDNNRFLTPFSDSVFYSKINCSFTIIGLLLFKITLASVFVSNQLNFRTNQFALNFFQVSFPKVLLHRSLASGAPLKGTCTWTTCSRRRSFGSSFRPRVSRDFCRNTSLARQFSRFSIYFF